MPHHSKNLISGVYFGAFAGVGLALSSLGPVLLELAARTDASLATMGYLFVGRAAGYVLGSAVGGPAFDRYSGHPMLAAAMVGASIGTTLVSLCRSVPALLLCLSAQGLAMGFLDTGGNVLLLRLHDGEASAEPYMQAMHFSFALGAFASPLLIRHYHREAEEGSAAAAAAGGADAGSPADVSAANELLAPFCIFGAFNLLVALALVLVPAAPPPPAAAAAAAAAAAESVESSATPAAAAGGWLRRYLPADAAERRVLLLAAGMLFWYVGAEVSYGGYIFAYGVRHLGFSDPQSHLLTACFWGGLAAGRLLAVPVSTRMSSARLLAWLVSGCLAAAAVMEGDAAGEGELVWATTAIYGLCMGPIFPAVVSLASRYIEVTGGAASVFVLGSASGEMLVPLAVAQLFEHAGPASFAACILAVAALTAASLLVLQLAGRRTPKFATAAAAAAGGAGATTAVGAAAATTGAQLELVASERATAI